MKADFENLILAYLHDPPDKALRIRGHESRAARLASIAAYQDIKGNELHKWTRKGDIHASISERIPMPTAGKDGERAVGTDDEGRSRVFHPLSGRSEDIQAGDSDSLIQDAEYVLDTIISGIDPPDKRFHLLWRLFMEQLSEKKPAIARLPADTRLPDHTLTNHIDISAGLEAAGAGEGGPAVFSFSLGPVQTFIAAARSLRDLWTGSYLLSWLIFQGMKPVLDNFGPTAFVFPALRGMPLVDLWLRNEKGLDEKVDRPPKQKLLCPCLPNRFLAIVPYGKDGADARELAGKCREDVKAAWKDTAGVVHGFLDKNWRDLDNGDDWNRLWEDQIEAFFDVRTAVLPVRGLKDDFLRDLPGSRNLWKRINLVRALADAIPDDHRPSYGQNNIGAWSAHVDFSARNMAAIRSVRHVPAYRPQGDVAQKCSLLGSYEQMGPARTSDSKAFWEEVVKKNLPGPSRVRKGERLSAVSLVKRFAWQEHLCVKLGLDENDAAFSDTATIAAREWLKKTGIDPYEFRRNRGRWNGQWLHWPRQENSDGERIPDKAWDLIREGKKKHKAPPAYYAILHMDGDNMSKWLSGEYGPTLSECLHRKIRGYYDGLNDELVTDAMKNRRPVSPALHASISEALSNFALHFVSDIVWDNGGEPIYAGGDDVLAILPVRTALKCARELRETFASEYKKSADGREHLLMGSKATVSAGIVAVHHKEDLRLALEAARNAEKKAKKYGRNALTLAVWRRSGEHAEAMMEWDFADDVIKWIGLFIENASDRWAYRLRQELPVLQGIECDAFKAEIKRLIVKGSDEKVKFEEKDVLEAFDKYYAKMIKRGRPDESIRADFVTLIQSTSFLARGRDS